MTAVIGNNIERQAAEQHLVQMESRYRGLLEAAPDAMVVVNESGNIVLLNVQAEYQFGYPRDELLGQPVINIIPEGFAERLIADDARTATEALAQHERLVALRDMSFPRRHKRSWWAWCGERCRAVGAASRHPDAARTAPAWLPEPVAA
jgi:PAS domain S-box-containing protein